MLRNGSLSVECVTKTFSNTRYCVTCQFNMMRKKRMTLTIL